MDSESVLALNQPSPGLIQAVEYRKPLIACSWISMLGYPFQYRVNERYLAEHAYAYHVGLDCWVVHEIVHG